MRRSSSFPSLKPLAVWLSTIAVCAVLLPGCETMKGWKEAVFKPEVQVTLNGAPTQNLDEKGLPLSVVVRLYALRSKEQVERVSMRALLRSDQEALGNDIVSRKEVILRPGITVKEIVSLKDPDKPKASYAEYLAVIAFLRKPEGDSWRQVIPLNNSTPNVEVQVQERGMKITLD